MSERYCGIDNFAISLEGLVADVFDACDENVGKAVSSSARKGARLLREKYTKGIGRHPWSDEYRGGFKSHVDRSGKVVTGEIGNKNKPGLVHLLEKGHVTPSGHRTGTFRHMDPAFEEVQEDFIEKVGAAVDSALRG